MAGLAVLLLRSTDAPEIAVAGLRAARAAAAGGARPPAALVLDAEGARVAARGVAEALSGGGRPDVKALLDGFLSDGGRLLVLGDAWRERGYQDDALVPGAALVGPEAIASLAGEGYVLVSY